MDYTKLGNTGMDVSRICLGCMGFGDAERWIHKWVLNEENSRPIIKKALELGINFFDTANVYSIGKSEEILGRALKDFANRDEVVVATKVHGKMHDGPNGAGLSRKAILWGSARSYRACLAVTKEAGDGAYLRGNEDRASGRCRRRSVR